MLEIVDLFCELVGIDSESGEEQAFIDRLQQILVDDLNADCRIDHFGNLIACLPAKDSGRDDPILLCAHADTVKPGKGIKPVTVDGVVRSAGETILGADDKAGIVEIIEALRVAERRPPVEVVITRGEEVGLLGVKELDRSALRSSMGFVLDGDELDEIVIGGPTYIAVDAEIIGKAAHAGLEPERGISALRVAAEAVLAIAEGRVDEETTANIGILQAGTIRNGVPERAELQGECRSLDHSKCTRQAERMKRAIERAAESAGAIARVRLTETMRAITIPEDSAVVGAAKHAIRSVGLEPKTCTIVGGTDASILNEKGIDTVVLGFGGRNAHSCSEEIDVSTMQTAILILRELLESLS